MEMREAPLEPYQAYIPVPGRFSGRYNGDSKNRVAVKDGKTIVTSTGTSWAEKFEARWPDAQRPSLSLETMSLQVGEVHLEDGSIRFIDRTTEPAFSEDLSKMDLLVTGLGNKPEQR